MKSFNWMSDSSTPILFVMLFDNLIIWMLVCAYPQVAYFDKAYSLKLAVYL